MVPHYSYLIHLVTSYAYCLYRVIFMVFVLKIFLNGLSLLKCLSRRFRNYFPRLMLVSLQNGRLNQITFLFLFFLHLFEWLLLVSPTLTNPWVPLPLLLPMVMFRPLVTEFTGFMYSSLLWNPLFLRAISYIFLFSTKNLYMMIVYSSSCLTRHSVNIWILT